jgi:hypothetical protein
VRRYFIDLDGVLGDFDGHFFLRFGQWPTEFSRSQIHKMLATDPYFFLELPAMEGAKDFWGWLQINNFNPIVLTGVPHQNYDQAVSNKKLWVAQNFGHRVPVITCRSEDKRLHGKPGDVLVDDRTKYQHLWEEMGGIFVHHQHFDITKLKLATL